MTCAETVTVEASTTRCDKYQCVTIRASVVVTLEGDESPRFAIEKMAPILQRQCNETAEAQLDAILGRGGRSLTDRSDRSDQSGRTDLARPSGLVTIVSEVSTRLREKAASDRVAAAQSPAVVVEPAFECQDPTPALPASGEGDGMDWAYSDYREGGVQKLPVSESIPAEDVCRICHSPFCNGEGACGEAQRPIGGAGLYVANRLTPSSPDWHGRPQPSRNGNGNGRAAACA
jgi:hypothetical protein